MILVLRPDASLDQIEHVIETVKELGFTPHVSRGESRTIVGVIGDETKPQTDNFSALPAVEQVHRILKPFKLASREFHKSDTVVYVGKVAIGGGSLAMIAGPCAIEGYDILDAIAKYCKAGGANILRGGAFKPRTSPYSFQGMGEDGLKILRDVGDKYDMPVVTEVMDPRQVELVCRYTDMLQLGA
ncbi:MAG: 3-deoxy-7-phosphoheptulonate synthase, partial [Gemmataceae bacterium]